MEDIEYPEICPLVKSVGQKFENDWNWPGKNLKFSRKMAEKKFEFLGKWPRKKVTEFRV
jgi:transcription initiation factor TFIID subunit TAF12